MHDTANGTAEAIIAELHRQLRARNWSQRQLAERAGLSTTQMSRVMSGDRKLTAGELGAIGNALGVSAATLLGEGDAARPLALAARLGRTGHREELDRPFRRAEELLKLRDLLDQILTRPDEGPAPELERPRTSYYKRAGELLAQRLREALGLGTEPVHELEALAARFGLDAATEPMPKKVHGLLVAGSAGGGATSTAIALLNVGDTLGRRRFTLAHELGHLLFDDAELYIVDYRSTAPEKPAPNDEAGLKEHRADCFAAHLLAPNEGVRQIAEELDGTGRDRLEWVAALAGRVAARFGISVESALIRAEDTGWATPEERQVLKRWSATRVLKAAEVEDRSVIETGTEVEPPSTLLAQALHAYRDGMLGLKPVATLYDVADLDALAGELHDAGWAPQYAAV